MEPGFYADVSTVDYLADKLTEQPSLNSTIARLMSDTCPAKARHEHPRLSGTEDDANGRDSSTRAMVRGSVAHTMLLGRGKQFSVIPHDSRRSKAARLECAEAESEGRIAILADEYQHIASMVTSAREQMVAIDRYAFDSEYGYAELCAIAQDPVGPLTRALIDWYGDRHPNGLVLWDYKTVDGSANPDTIRWTATRHGWAFQAAFQARIIHWLQPNLRPQFRFLVQETSPPFLCSAVEPDTTSMILAHKAVAAAIGMWQRCMTAGIWPGYPTEPRLFGVTPGTETAWVDREYDPGVQAMLSADPFLNTPVTPAIAQVHAEAAAEPQEAIKRRGGRPRLTPEERAQRAAQRSGGAVPASTPRKLDL